MCCLSSAEFNAFRRGSDEGRGRETFRLELADDPPRAGVASAQRRHAGRLAASQPVAITALAPTASRPNWPRFYRPSTESSGVRIALNMQSMGRASTKMRLPKSVAALIDVMLWPLMWAAAEVKTLGEYLRKQIARFNS
jgi:hypothetical protein